MKGRLAALVLVPLLVGLYGVWAYTGVRGGIAMARGRLSPDAVAVPLFERAAVGLNRFQGLRRAAAGRIDIWQRQAKRGGPMGADPELLARTAEGYLESLCVAPASWAPWEGLGLVYHELEWIGRERRSEVPAVPGTPPWEKVGRDGRISIGMFRRAIEAGPNWYLNFDTLGRNLWLYGLEADARLAVRASARALPIYHRHEYRIRSNLPEWVLVEFADASREALGEVPFVPPTTHLIDLAKLERRLGREEAAIELLTRALDRPGDVLNRGEANLYLGLALVSVGEVEHGRRRLLEAAEVPVFRTAAYLGLTSAAELAGEEELALRYLRDLRRRDPRNVAYCLRFANVARRAENWAAAIEALEWAMTVAPKDPLPPVVLIQTLVEKGDLPAARSLARRVMEWVPEEHRAMVPAEAVQRAP